MAICSNTQTNQQAIYDNHIVPMTIQQQSRAHIAGYSIMPLDADGTPSANGKVGFLSVGPSSMVQIFNAFMEHDRRKGFKRDEVVLCNGAEGGYDSAMQADPGSDYWDKLDMKLARAGLEAAQVQACWVYAATKFEVLPYPEHAIVLQGYLESIVDILLERFPNIKVIAFTSREYGGYSSLQTSLEPWAREGGYAIDALVRDNETSNTVPWIGWGPYTWADGLNARPDGLAYRCSDFEKDGLHPGRGVERKVVKMLLSWLMSHPAGSWFSRG